MSNADIAPTLAFLINIDMPFVGTLRGRILREALRGTTDLPVVTQEKRVSGPFANAATVLLYQSVGDERYYNEACLANASAALGSPNPCR